MQPLNADNLVTLWSLTIVSVTCCYVSDVVEFEKNYWKCLLLENSQKFRNFKKLKSLKKVWNLKKVESFKNLEDEKAKWTGIDSDSTADFFSFLQLFPKYHLLYLLKLPRLLFITAAFFHFHLNTWNDFQVKLLFTCHFLQALHLIVSSLHLI